MDRGLAFMMLWVLAFHLGLCVSCQGQQETSRDCTVFGNVSISCYRNLTASTMTYRLHKNGQILHVVSSENKSQYEETFSTGEVSRFIHTLDRGPSFEISKLSHNSSGVYVCEVYNIYPPPIIYVWNYTEVVFIENTCRTVESPCPGGLCGTKPPPILIPTHTPLLVALGLVTVYGLLLTPVTFKLWRTARKSQFEDHDYINMRPFGRRRYNGVQHPVHPGNRMGLSCNCMEAHEESSHFGIGKLP